MTTPTREIKCFGGSVHILDIPNQAQFAGSMRNNTPINLAIIPLGFPNILLSTEHLRQIEAELLQAVIDQRAGSSKPRFLGCQLRPGWLTIRCKNVSTAAWLVEQVATMQVRTGNHGCELLAIQDALAARPDVFVGEFPIGQAGNNPDVILGLLGGQNRGLRVNQWRLVHSQLRCAHTVMIAVALDPKSVKKVQKRNYRLAYAFGEITMRPSQYFVDEDEQLGYQSNSNDQHRNPGGFHGNNNVERHPGGHGDMAFDDDTGYSS